MDPDFAQRRRVAVALAITVIAVPAAFLLNRGGDDGVATVPPPTVVGTTPDGGGDTDVSSASPAITDAMGTAPPDLDTRQDLPVDDDPARIAIPRIPEGIEGTATFRNEISDPTLCQAPDVPFNAQITVTNLDNSKSVQCIAGVGGARPDDDVVLHADAFQQIADITDAPVPVRITW